MGKLKIPLSSHGAIGRRCSKSGEQPLSLRSGIDTSQLGHSYYGGAKAVLSDISDLIKSGHRAAQRSGLSAHGTGAGGYWQILSSSSASAP